MDVAIIVIEALAFVKHTRFYICLAFPCAQEDISSSSGLHRAFQNIVMFMFVAIVNHIRAMLIELKVSPYAILHILQIRVIC
ncbi:hypothetical protein D3C85_1741730 [compost metagenome]